MLHSRILITLLHLFIILVLCFYSVIRKACGGCATQTAIPALFNDSDHFRPYVHGGVLFHRLLVWNSLALAVYSSFCWGSAWCSFVKNYLNTVCYNKWSIKLWMKIVRSLFFFQSLCGKNLTTILNEYVAMKTKGKPSEWDFFFSIYLLESSWGRFSISPYIWT